MAKKTTKNQPSCCGWRDQMCGELISKSSIDGFKQFEAGEHKRCAAYETVTGMSLVKNGSTEMSEKDPKNVCSSYFKWFKLHINSGWWLVYPSEKWWSSSIGMIIEIPNINGKMRKKWQPNHQPELHCRATPTAGFPQVNNGPGHGFIVLSHGPMVVCHLPILSNEKSGRL